jgi:methyl-accepting chemotaxis protein
VREINHISNEIAPHSENVLNLNDISISLESIESNIDKYINLGYQEYKDNYNKEIENSLAYLEQAQTDFREENLRSEEPYHEPELEKINEFEESIHNLKKNLALFEDTSPDTIKPGTMNTVLVITYSEIKKSKQIINELLVANTNDLKQYGAQQKKATDRLTNQFFIIVIVIIAIGLFFSYNISISISRPIKKLTGNVNRISKGDFDVKLEQSNIDEIKDLTNSLNRILASMKLAILKTGVKKEDIGIGTKEALEAKKKAEQKLLKQKENYKKEIKKLKQQIKKTKSQKKNPDKLIVTHSQQPL